MSSFPSQDPSSPPRLAWPDFAAQFVGGWQQGQHCLFVGPTGSGKTVAARTLARARDYNVVIGTKVRDREMDAYLAEGYYRIDHWPPLGKDWRAARKVNPEGKFWFCLWPKIKTREDLRSTANRRLFANALDDLLVDEGWTVVADEGLWLSSPRGLNVGAQLEALSYTGRSSKITLMILLQRPRGVPVLCWTSASYAFLWHMGNTDDVRELASLGVKDRRAAQLAVTQLRGHDFLFLPCRATSDWAVTRVDME